MPKKQKNNSKLTESQKLIDYILSKGITTVVVNTGEKDEEKKFLGYEFSTRKNQEGIHEFEDGSMLYSKNSDGSVNLNDDSNKVNYYIRQSFKGKKVYELKVSNSLEKNVKITTQDNLFDFERGNRINVNPKLSLSDSKYNRVLLSDSIFLVEKGTAITRNEIIKGDIPVVAGGIEPSCYGNKSNRNGECVTIAASGSAGYVSYWDRPIFASDCITIQVLDIREMLCKYLYEYLAQNQSVIYSYKVGQANVHVYSEDIKNFRIPKPPISVQESIIFECKIVDTDVYKSISDIKRYQQEIEVLINDMIGKKALLGDNSRFEIGIGRRMLSKDVKGIGNIPVYSANVRKPFGYTDSLLDSFNNFDCDTAVWSIDNDWDTNYFPANYKFRPTDHTGYIRVKDNSIHPYLVSKLLYNAGVPCHFSRDYRASVEKIMELSIIIPEKSIQEKVVTECLDIEKKIIDAQTIINTARQRKDAILDKYLK